MHVFKVVQIQEVISGAFMANNRGCFYNGNVWVHFLPFDLFSWEAELVTVLDLKWLLL